MSKKTFQRMKIVASKAAAPAPERISADDLAQLHRINAKEREAVAGLQAIRQSFHELLTERYGITGQDRLQVSDGVIVRGPQPPAKAEEAATT